MAGFKGLNKYRKRVKTNAEETLHKFVFVGFSTLIKNSPVLLGNFRGNWLGSKVTPRIGDSGNFAIGSGGGDQGGTVQSQRMTNPGITKGMPPTAFEKSNLGTAMTAKLGETVYITNNLAYAGALENGHSQQAPNGVLHVSAQEVRAKSS